MIRVEPVPFEPPRAPAWARPGGSFRDHSEAEALFFAGAALVRARSRREIRPAVGRRLAPPPGPEIRRRGRGEPAQPARGRGGAARRGRARQTRPGPRAGGAGLFRLPDALRSGRSLPSQAARRRRRRSAGAARPRQGRGARRRARAGRRARQAGPARRGRGRRGGDRARAPTPSRSRCFCADAALARSLGWPTPLPLLASELFARRATGEGRRPRPGEAGWGKLVALSYARAALAALDLAQELSRRAARLDDAAPKLRAKGKTGAIEALLADDAVSAAAPIAGLSDRACRRLFDRLVALKRRARAHRPRRPSGSTGSDRHGPEAEPRAGLRPRACRRAAGSCAGANGRRGSRRCCLPRRSR